jgi:hypothetical protein
VKGNSRVNNAPTASMVSMVYPSQCPIPIGTSTEQSIPRNEGLGDGAVGKERPCRQTVEALLAPPSTAWQRMATAWQQTIHVPQT